jgi:hypothetical protein
MIHESTPRQRKAPQFKSRLTELRSLSHSLAAELGYCEDARRNILLSVGGSRYARDMDEAALEVVVAWMEARKAERTKRRPYTPEEMTAIINATSVESLLA